MKKKKKKGFWWICLYVSFPDHFLSFIPQRRVLVV